MTNRTPSCFLTYSKPCRALWNRRRRTVWCCLAWSSSRCFWSTLFFALTRCYGNHAGHAHCRLFANPWIIWIKNGLSPTESSLAGKITRSCLTTCSPDFAVRWIIELRHCFTHPLFSFFTDRVNCHASHVRQSKRNSTWTSITSQIVAIRKTSLSHRNKSGFAYWIY